MAAIPSTRGLSHSAGDPKGAPPTPASVLPAAGGCGDTVQGGPTIFPLTDVYALTQRRVSVASVGISSDPKNSGCLIALLQACLNEPTLYENVKKQLENQLVALKNRLRAQDSLSIAAIEDTMKNSFASRALETWIELGKKAAENKKYDLESFIQHLGSSIPGFLANGDILEAWYTFMRPSGPILPWASKLVTKKSSHPSKPGSSAKEIKENVDSITLSLPSDGSNFDLMRHLSDYFQDRYFERPPGLFFCNLKRVTTDPISIAFSITLPSDISIPYEEKNTDYRLNAIIHGLEGQRYKVYIQKEEGWFCYEGEEVTKYRSFEDIQENMRALDCKQILLIYTPDFVPPADRKRPRMATS